MLADELLRQICAPGRQQDKPSEPAFNCFGTVAINDHDDEVGLVGKIARYPRVNRRLVERMPQLGIPHVGLSTPAIRERFFLNASSRLLAPSSCEIETRRT